jgi:hypothetical protein
MSRIWIIILLLFLGKALLAQNILPLGWVNLDDYYRREQLRDTLIDQSWSSMVRPSRPLSDPDLQLLDLVDSSRWVDINSYLPKSKWIEMRVLPFLYKSRYNHKHPYSWNDGSMIPGRGYQQLISMGLYGKIGLLEVQINPELVYADNRTYESMPDEQFPVLWYRFYAFYQNYIDTPYRFGEHTFSRISPGQSRIGLTYKSVSAGISSENIWWGPGIRNSLLMSNNSPGFNHLYLRSQYPIKTLLGSFEGQIIGGRLESSNFEPPGSYKVYEGRFLYRKPNNEWRYLFGYNFVYQPKWIPGLYLGMSRVFQRYHTSLNGMGDYFPLFDNLFRDKDSNPNEAAIDELIAISFRVVIPKIQTEIYGEMARNDAALNLRHFFLVPTFSSAFNFGFQKVFDTQNRIFNCIQWSTELTQMAKNTSANLKDPGPFYIHSRVRQGYTHRGEVLGAGIGSGSNLQSTWVKFIRGYSSLGFRVERYVHNNDYYNIAYDNTGDFRRHWVDLSGAVTFSWEYKNLLINGDITGIHSFNYQYQLEDYDPPAFFVPGKDVRNFVINLDVLHRF